MLILGIDTATARSSVCLGGAGGLLASAALGVPRSHGEFVAPAIAFCLEHAGVDLDAVDGVAVTLGPGLYTGLRVGIATAQALAHARHLPVVGRSSLDLLALRLRHAAPGREVWSVVDAKRRELFWARYRVTADAVQRVGDAQVGNVDRLLAEVERVDAQVCCVGDGAVAHAGQLAAVGVEVASPWDAHPSAETLVEHTLSAFRRDETQRPEDLRPLYLRVADTKISWRNRGALHGGSAEAPRAESTGTAVASTGQPGLGRRAQGTPEREP